MGIFMAMIGLAGAVSVNVTPLFQDISPGQSLNPLGSFKTYDIKVRGIIIDSNIHQHTIYAQVTGWAKINEKIPSGIPDGNDLRFRFKHNGIYSGWLGDKEAFSWDDAVGLDSNTLTVDVIDTGSAQNYIYQFNIYDSFSPSDIWISDTAYAKVDGISIPDFPKIALPVGAAIGLIFLYQSRKNKKEE
jgi:hypothetical protein